VAPGGSRRGLNALDTAVNVAIPEFDGRIITVPVSFKERSAVGAESPYVAHEERTDRVAGIAARLAILRRIPNQERRVAFVLTNSAAKASQVGGAVGLDSPASLLTTLRAMRARRYSISSLPDNSDELMQNLLRYGTYDERYPLDPEEAMRFSRPAYRTVFSSFPERPNRRMQDFGGSHKIVALASGQPKRLIRSSCRRLGAKSSQSKQKNLGATMMTTFLRR
jgi:cobaltochelatase CobN